MQLTFSCPSCGKEYEAPWSMSGKRAHCRRCDNEFVVPAPFEAKPPRSSEAIPVLGEPDPAPPPPPPKVISVGPPPNEVLEKLRTGSRATTVRVEVPSRAPTPPPDPTPEPAPAPAPRTMRIEAMPSSPVPSDRSTDPWPVPDRRAFPPASIPSKDRPAWLLPACAGGGLALIVALNVGLYFTFLGGGDVTSKVAKPEAPGLVAAGLSKPLDAKGSAEVAAPVVVEPVSIKEVISSTRPVPPRKAKGEPAPDRVMSTSEIVSRYEPSVAMIKGKKKSGTGFIARAGVIATNAHVIEGERVKDLEVRFPSAEIGMQGPFAAKLLHLDKDRDLALLGVVTDLPPIRVAEAYKFRKGEDVTVIGNPSVGGQIILENAISRGIVSSMTTINNHSFLQLGIAINPGNSGGPVFDPKGRVIGVVTLKTTLQEGLAFAIPATDLRKALDSIAMKVEDKEGEEDPNPPKSGRR